MVRIALNGYYYQNDISNSIRSRPPSMRLVFTLEAQRILIARPILIIRFLIHEVSESDVPTEKVRYAGYTYSKLFIGVMR